MFPSLMRPKPPRRIAQDTFFHQAGILFGNPVLRSLFGSLGHQFHIYGIVAAFHLLRVEEYDRQIQFAGKAFGAGQDGGILVQEVRPVVQVVPARCLVGDMLPKNVSKGSIIKSYDEDGQKHYDFQFKNKRGYKMTIEGLDGKFNPEFWNYAKLISGVLRYGMPIDQVIKLVQGMELNNESINTWKNGVERALKKYLPNGTEAKGQKCPNCGHETLVYQEGCLICTNCGASRCG